MTSGLFARLNRAALAFMVAGALTGPGPVLAAGPSMSVSGDSKLSDCGAAKKPTFSTELTGSLAGCWSTFVAHFNCQEMNGFSLYTELGREEFTGKLEGEDVSFDTQYTFTGLFPKGSCPEPKPEKEVVGGCVHYITGKSLIGIIRFYDVMAGEGAPHFFYEGNLTKI